MRMEPYWRTILLFSLVLGVFRSVIDFISSLASANPWSLLTLAPLGYLALYMAQVFGAFKHARWVWMVSLVQIAAFPFFGIATFGYVNNYLLKGVPWGETGWSAGGLALLAEVLKTLYFYRCRPPAGSTHAMVGPTAHELLRP